MLMLILLFSSLALWAMARLFAETRPGQAPGLPEQWMNLGARALLAIIVFRLLIACL